MGLTRLVRWQIEEGINGLVPCGTTGEAPTLSWEERLDIIGQCVKIASGRIPIIAGTGTNSTEATIGFTAAAESLGADAALDRDALLQQAEPGRDISPLRGDRPQGQNPDHRLQCSVANRRRSLAANDQTPGGNSRDRRHQGRHRRFQPAVGDFRAPWRPLPAILRPRCNFVRLQHDGGHGERFPSLRMWRPIVRRDARRLQAGQINTPQGRSISGCAR